jgi:MoxR-like ATPase
VTADTPSPVRDDSAAVISGAGGAGDPRDALAAVRNEIGKAVVGQDQAVTGLIIALLCRGHVLLEGVPGVAKTLLVRALAAALALDTRRIQVTPDLMPGAPRARCPNRSSWPPRRTPSSTKERTHCLRRSSTGS